MRLTLRTLLAYRDRVLNPAELHDMHGRVQQSAMASNLLKRIDALSQRTNILAPPVDGRGLGADANSIAEYLDDTLTGEKVPELERICLESDVQLAELSHCHQLLSTAQSTLVDVSPALRMRLIAWHDPAVLARALAERPTGLTIEPETKAALSRAAAKESAQEAHSSKRSHAPAELRDGGAIHRSDVAHAATNSAARNGSGNGNGSTSPTPLPSAGKQLVTAQRVEAPMMASGGDSIKPTGLDLEGSHLAHEVPEYLRGRARDGWRGPLAIGALVALLCLIAWQSMGSWSSVREMFAPRSTMMADTSRGQDASGAVAGAAANANKPSGNGQPAALSDSNNRAATGAAGDGTANSNTAGNRPGSLAPPVKSAQSTLPLDISQRSDLAPVPLPEATGPFAAQWLPVDGDATQAILFAQASGQMLHRVQPGESLPTATQLFIPSALRPTIDIGRGPRWSVCGLTHMLVIQPEGESQATPVVDLRLGRALLTPSANASSIVINTVDSQIQLTMSDAATQVAVELTYLPIAHGPLNDRNAYAPTLIINAVSGSATVQLAPAANGISQATDASAQSTKAMALPAGQMLMISRGTATAPSGAEAPWWIDAASERPIDRLAAQDLAKQISPDEPVGDVLHKLATGRRPETRALAAQALALLGAWDWVTQEKTTLNESRDRNYWFALLDASRQLIAANPENANTLQAVLTARDANAGAWRAQVWLGLNQSQLEGDGLGKMVAMLESEELQDRILSIYQLQRLTGKDLGYQAGELNRTIAQQWGRELAAGKVQLLPVSKLPK